MNRKLWCIGGGKGGVGKSIFTLGLGIALRASWGKIKGLFGVKPKPSDEDDEDETK